MSNFANYGINFKVRGTELVEGAEQANDNYVYEGVASATSMDRSGFFGINVTGGRLENYELNPVVLLSHTSNTENFPIGKALDIYYENGELIIRFELYKDGQKANEVKKFIDDGLLNALSIGFTWTEDDVEIINGTYFLKSWELTEVSVVNVGEDPKALLRVNRGLGGGFDVEKALRNLSPLEVVEESEQLTEFVTDIEEREMTVDSQIAELLEQVRGLSQVVELQQAQLESERLEREADISKDCQTGKRL